MWLPGYTCKAEETAPADAVKAACRRGAGNASARIRPAERRRGPGGGEDSTPRRGQMLTPVSENRRSNQRRAARLLL
ncbi:unnamed protein product [Gadus morhua 'NCC']